MDESISSQQFSTNTKKLLMPVGCLFLIGLCVCIPLYFALADRIYPILVNLIAPTPKRMSLSKPFLFLSDLPPSYEVLWSKDGALIGLEDKKTGAELVFDVNSGVDVTEDQKNKFDPSPLKNELYNFQTSCPIQPYHVQVTSPGSIDEKPEYFILNLQKGNENAAFHISPMQNNSSVYYLFPYQLAFSPDCKWLAIALWGPIADEAEAREELWLLDVENNKVEFAFFGRWPAFGIWDYPVQSVRPSWSPDSKEFVFGDGQFGLEIYNVERKDRRWLVGPELAGYESVWSSTGKWIAASRWEPEDALIILSADGKYYDIFQECRLFFEYIWSPVEDRLIFECSSEGAWIWNMPEVDGE